ncbi:transcription-repair coupling factor [Psychrobacter celer]|uniref:transcription-repair coupling factor n=1 Tax=Psychrobacter TaxID=497 RepID=UPI000946B689|nr:MULTISPECIES: transcription-repair coupling factor [unclassified Psychrobacter]MDN5732810.1 transcription-repair coupling factor [Psychrobacter sp.]OLF42049.1 transcription-repair coupling factor [Psychrobacter sp. Rd 27.2]PJX21180.1 transcription-repair coupling factor [Psychrobacter sp. L7]
MPITALTDAFDPINQQLFPIAHAERRWLTPVYGAVSSLWLASLMQALVWDVSERLKVVVTRDQNQLNQIETELAFCGVDAYVFPDWETLTYDELSPHQDIVSERINLLTDMPTKGVLLISVQALMHRVAPPSWLIGQHFDLSVGDRFDINTQRELLAKAGYRAVENVFEPGEFAVRGSIVDIFAMGQPFPLRLDLFDDEIETIRFFNPQTQRTLTVDDLKNMMSGNDSSIGKESLSLLHKLPDISKPIQQFQILPAKEFPLDEGRETFRTNFAAMFPNTSSRKSELHKDVMAGIASSGLEYYQPLFFDLDDWQADSSLFAYLPDDALFIIDERIHETQADYWSQIQRRYEERRHDIDKPIVAPELLYLLSNTLNEHLNHYPRVMLSAHETRAAIDNDASSTAQAASNRQGLVTLTAQQPPQLAVNHQKAEPLADLLEFLLQQAQTATPVLIVAETAGRREILIELFKGKVDTKAYDSFEAFLAADKVTTLNDNNLPQVGLTVAPIERGVYIPERLVVISETQLFGRQVLQTRRRRQSGVSEEFLVKSVTEITEGSPVVHIEHGIGRYNGLITLDVGDGEQEFIHLKYADDASIYVPVANLQMISRYSGGDPALAPLHKIGSGKWDKAKQKALEQIHDVAAELLNMQARREAKVGIHFKIDPSQYELFASQFAFEETADQANAIHAVMEDMRQNQPMDRLICGDVGFGKTEVAMRAAFIAVSAGYQVAVLVPTTLLAGQHEDNFRDRFADWPVRIETLSRFGGKKHQETVLADLAAGKVDIVIGTHKLLQPDVKFANLGLMIVDEEHRFGVRHKERIKAIQTDVDSMSMTATPIPRTLNMALSGMRDMSIIATPPARRLAIKTFVMQKTDALMKEAILRELLRGGQVYLLHNDVASIERMAETIRELVPEARVGVAHGQMQERQLEQIMEQFYHKKFNVLVCSTIIETGIDVPNANTIIIERADKFGLAQLHQLRGRVGRSHHQAYCYLLVPSIKGLKGDAKRRLHAIERANTLGAGFMLASEDLEIRGAGEILGKQQSGNMQAIGFSLYMDMLERATKAIKAGKEPDLNTPLSLTSEINLHSSALIPEEYLHDVHQRLLFYKRISNADDFEALTDIRTEMIDRFGTLPDQTKHLFAIHRLRIQAEPLKINKIDANSSSMTLEFAPDTPVDALAIIQLIQKDGQRYRMNGASGIRYQDANKLATPQQRVTVLEELLRYFSEHMVAEPA